VLVETLSDHPGAELAATRQTMADQQAHRVAALDLRARQAASRRWWQLGKRLAHAREWRAFVARRPAPDPHIRSRLAQQAAGVDAEDAMTAALQPLPDSWTLFRGYQNRRGEIDHLLAGPGGVWAIEVKGRGIHVYVNNDKDWKYDKFDRYGNLVDQGPLTDNRGRSWGLQVLEPAGDLQAFLASRGVAVAIHTAVILMHDRASVGWFRNSNVDVLSAGPGHLFSKLRSQAKILDAATVDQVVALVRRDHQFHAGKRSQRHRNHQNRRRPRQ